MTGDVIARFEMALRRGIGRTALMLRDDPTNGAFHAALLDACKKVVSYDAQCEDSRAPWLRGLIGIAGVERPFWRALVDHLGTFADDADSDDVAQVFDLLCRLAADAPDLDRTPLRNVVTRCAAGWDGFFGLGPDTFTPLVRLEGSDALSYIVDANFEVLRKVLETGDAHVFRWLIDALPAPDDAARAAMIEDARAKSSQLDRLLNMAATCKAWPTATPAPHPDYAALKARDELAMIARPRWANDASPGDLARAAADLLAETDADRIFYLLRLFAWRDWPLEPRLLFPFVETGTERICWQATQTLGRLADPSVRALALVRLGADPAAAIHMLSGSCEQGDLDAIETAVRAATFDEDQWHGVGTSLLHLLDRTGAPTRDAHELLLLLYENTPCSLCRQGATARLADAGLAPAWMRAECPFDSDQETAALFSAPPAEATI